MDNWTRVATLPDCGTFELADGDRRAYMGHCKIIHEWKDEPTRRVAYLLSRTSLRGLPDYIIPQVPKNGSYLKLHNTRNGQAADLLVPHPHLFQRVLRDIQKSHAQRASTPEKKGRRSKKGRTEGGRPAA